MFFLSISEDILLYVCGLGILQGILLAALIYFHSKSDRSVNIFLALLIFFQSVMITFPLVLKLVPWPNTGFIQPVPLLIGPLIYFYVRSFKEKITWVKALPHFIPFVLFFYPTYMNMAYMSAKYPGTAEPPAEVLRHPYTMILMYVRLIHIIIYYFLARKTLRTYQRSIRQLFSETSRINLQWVKFLLNGYMLLFITIAIMFVFVYKYPQYLSLFLLITMACTSVYIYAVTFRGIAQPSLWQEKHGVKKEELEEDMQQAETIETPKPEVTAIRPVKGLSEDRINSAIKQIQVLMEGQKLYNETDLTLRQLAEKLQLPAYQVSQVINEGMKKNFYDLVNAYRVEAAKRLLLDPGNSNYTVLSIGFEAGFNSKTTFNTVFKKFTGLTPTEYREHQKMAVADA